MKARNLDPHHMTDAQGEGIIGFPHALLPVKDRVIHIKKHHHPDDILELTRHLTMLVEDLARELQTPNLRRITERQLERPHGISK